MQRVAVTNRRVLGRSGFAPRSQEFGGILYNFAPISARLDSTHLDERNHTHLVENKQSGCPPLDTISDLLCNAGFVAHAFLPVRLEQTTQGRLCHHNLPAVQNVPALKSRIPHRKLTP